MFVFPREILLRQVESSRVEEKMKNLKFNVDSYVHHQQQAKLQANENEHNIVKKLLSRCFRSPLSKKKLVKLSIYARHKVLIQNPSLSAGFHVKVYKSGHCHNARDFNELAFTEFSTQKLFYVHIFISFWLRTDAEVSHQNLIVFERQMN